MRGTIVFLPAWLGPRRRRALPRACPPPRTSSPSFATLARQRPPQGTQSRRRIPRSATGRTTKRSSQGCRTTVGSMGNDCNVKTKINEIIVASVVSKLWSHKIFLGNLSNLILDYSLCLYGIVCFLPGEPARAIWLCIRASSIPPRPPPRRRGERSPGRSPGPSSPWRPSRSRGWRSCPRKKSIDTRKIWSYFPRGRVKN